MKRIVPLLFLVAMACASTPSNVRYPIILHEAQPFVEGITTQMYSGDVLIRGTVGLDGLLYDAQVVNSVPPEIAEIALAAASEYAFRPGTIDGQPEEMTYQFSIRFRRQTEH
jgi:hypothetical protein